MLKCEDLIRAHLRENRYGATTKDLAQALQISVPLAHATVKAMPDTYVDRWESNGSRIAKNASPWLAVWCIVDVPPDCPKPV